MADNRFRIDGGIIAGGLGTRMGGVDKGLLSWHEACFAEHIASKLRPHCNQLLINCNRNFDRYAVWADQVIRDDTQDYNGPLEGLKVLLRASTANYMLLSPCDTPRIPADYAPRMLATWRKYPGQLIAVKAADRIHPLHLLVPTRLHESISDYLLSGERRMMRWLEGQQVQYCDFSAEADCFTNVNSHEALALLGL